MTARTDLHVFTARMPVSEYEGLRAFAFFTQTSINEVVLAAIRSHLQEQITEDRLNALVERMRAMLGLGDR